MPSTLQALYLFISPQGTLAEIKRLDLPDGTPKHQVYHWLWLTESAVTPLHFVAMESAPVQQRTFEEAALSFDEVRGELRWAEGAVVDLLADPRKELSAGQLQRLQTHFGWSVGMVRSGMA